MLGYTAPGGGQSQPNGISYGSRIDCGKGTGTTAAVAEYTATATRKLVPAQAPNRPGPAGWQQISQIQPARAASRG